MILLDIEINKESGTIFAIIKSETKNKYCLLMNSLGTVCTCLGDQMRPHKQITCRHKRFLFSYLSKNYKDLNLNFLHKVDKNVTFLKTGLPFIDELFGGIPYKLLFGLVGTPKSGKTKLAYQLLHYMGFMENQDVLYIDGEGGVFDFVAKHNVEIFNNQFNCDLGVDRWTLDYSAWEPQKEGRKKLPPSKIKFDHLVDSGKERKIHVFDLLGNDGYEAIEKLNLLVGKPSFYTISKGGKISIKPDSKQLRFRRIQDIPLSQFIIEHKIKALVLDSLTMVVDTKFSGETEAFPARAKNNMQICNQLQNMVAYNNMYGIINHHVTQNPQNPYDIGEMTGGKGVGHNFKFQALIYQYGHSPSKRWIKILRHQNKPSGLKDKFEITSNGITEFIEDEK